MLAVLLVLLLALAAALPAPAAANHPPERALYEDAPSGMYLLDDGWSTRADRRDIGQRHRWYRPGRDRGFRRVGVPHAFNARDDSSRGFRSRVQWYRTSFDLPSRAGARHWRIRFESVNREASVWVNGRRIGSHEGAHLPFELSAPGLRRRGNELVVRVDGRMSRTDLPPSTRPRGWWNYGGILREVYLRAVPVFDLGDLQAVPQLGAQSASLSVRARVRSHARGRHAATYVLSWRALPAGGEPGPWQSRRVPTDELRSHGLGRIREEIAIEEPLLWTPGEPNLYELRVRLRGGQVTTAHVGLREWGVDEQGRATLNDRPLSLRGASFHEETLNRGAALGPKERAQIVGELKALGVDVARQHYPPHPALLEAFDREGIVFWEQIPVWRLRDRHFRSRRLRGEALDRLREAILRDRNHASVMTWSIANETLRGGRYERRYVSSARRLARRLDPTRLVAADASLRPVDQIPSHYRTLDAIGVNEYVGWYGGDSAELPGDLHVLRERFPGQALFVTEVGAEANREGPETEKGTYAFQRDYLAQHLGLMEREAPFLSGALVWALRDFWVRPRWSGGNPQPDPPFNRKGIFDERGAPKPALEAVRGAFDALPSTR